MSRDYKLYELSHELFENLCSRICKIILGEGFINFSEGKDGGRDGKFEGRAMVFPSKTKPYQGKFIIQAKHTTNAVGTCSDGKFSKVLREEIPKIKRLQDNKELEHYFLLTNRKLAGNQESIIQKKIRDEVPLVNSVSIWGKETIHLFLDDNKALHGDFGFNHARSPLVILAEDLSKVIKEFSHIFSKNTIANRGGGGKDFLYVKIEKKNEINSLSEDYYNHIKDDSERYFHYIQNFLKAPRNSELRTLYNDTAYDFKGVIISRRDDYEKFDQILEDLYSEAFSQLKKCSVNKKVLKLFIHFMYFNCDIGSKEE